MANIVAWNVVFFNVGPHDTVSRGQQFDIQTLRLINAEHINVDSLKRKLPTFHSNVQTQDSQWGAFYDLSFGVFNVTWTPFYSVSGRGVILVADVEGCSPGVGLHALRSLTRTTRGAHRGSPV